MNFKESKQKYKPNKFWGKTKPNQTTKPKFKMYFLVTKFFSKIFWKKANKKFGVF